MPAPRVPQRPETETQQNRRQWLADRRTRAGRDGVEPPGHDQQDERIEGDDETSPILGWHVGAEKCKYRAPEISLSFGFAELQAG